MALGYAKARPPVHARIIERVQESLPVTQKFRRALDVGCGAGLSTKPLEALADECIGIEPVEEMLRWTSEIAPHARFLVGSGEALPIDADSIDVIAAAGSLNYLDIKVFFQEARRVLTERGVVVVYDFSQGRSFRGSGRLDEWFGEFVRRYPRPKGEATTITPDSLARLDCGFKVDKSEEFEAGLPMTRERYVDYMMTETNVAFAVRNGVPQEEIRLWCAETLRSVFEGSSKEVLFRGYFACMLAA